MDTTALIRVTQKNRPFSSRNCFGFYFKFSSWIDIQVKNFRGSLDIPWLVGRFSRYSNFKVGGPKRPHHLPPPPGPWGLRGEGVQNFDSYTCWRGVTWCPGWISLLPLHPLLTAFQDIKISFAFEKLLKNMKELWAICLYLAHHWDWLRPKVGLIKHKNSGTTIRQSIVF